MAIKLSKRRVSASRIETAARGLLQASTLCAIATVGDRGRAHVHTAYFAWSPAFEIVWLSEPAAAHSANIRANDSVAIAVYDSGQQWGKDDRGLQLFGTAAEVDGDAAARAERLYATRFPAPRPTGIGAYRLYVFRASRVKLFDERELGAGVFVTARIGRDRRPVWQRTEIYAPNE